MSAYWHITVRRQRLQTMHEQLDGISHNTEVIDTDPLTWLEKAWKDEDKKPQQYQCEVALVFVMPITKVQFKEWHKNAPADD